MPEVDPLIEYEQLISSVPVDHTFLTDIHDIRKVYNELKEVRIQLLRAEKMLDATVSTI